MNVQSVDYWSSSTYAENPANAWDMGFGGGGVSNGNKTTSIHAWCVRGPMREAVY